jgi:hypothetical protein
MRRGPILEPEAEPSEEFGAVAPRRLRAHWGVSQVESVLDRQGQTLTFTIEVETDGATMFEGCDWIYTRIQSIRQNATRIHELCTDTLQQFTNWTAWTGGSMWANTIQTNVQSIIKYSQWIRTKCDVALENVGDLKELFANTDQEWGPMVGNV